MRVLWSPKFITANLIGLAVLQIFSSVPGFDLASLIGGEPPFSAKSIIGETNTFRADVGVSALRESSTLDAAAAQKLEDMGVYEYFAHTSPAGVSPWHWFDASGYAYRFAGENLALGFADAKPVVDAWAKSPAHRKNLANGRYTEIGVAVGRVSIAGASGVLVVQLFGTPLTESSVVLTQTSPPVAGSIRPPAAITVPRTLAAESDRTPALPAERLPVPDFGTSRRIAAGVISRTFAVYAAAVALGAMVSVVAVERRRGHLLKTLAHAGIATAAIVILGAVPPLAAII